MNTNTILLNRTVAVLDEGYKHFVETLSTLVRGYAGEYPDDEIYWFSEEGQNEISYLLETCQKASPQGYSFGSHPHWPNEWGWWKHEEIRDGS
jgi:hypothetical protein